jgi:Spy/CpxP family protein refolding chaperone
MGKGYGLRHGVWGFLSSYGVTADLNLTPEQLSQWNELQNEFFAEMLPLRNQLFSKQMELSALMTQPNADPQATQRKQQEVSALQSQIQEKAMARQLAFRQTLTPEQLSAWNAWRAAPPWCPYGVRMGMGRGPGMGPGMGMGPGRGMGRGCWNW